MGKNLFNSIKLTKPKTNVFDLSHDVKMSLDMGNLTPIMCLEAVPGDRFNISCESLLRFAPLVSPVMHRMDVTMHYFFVPNRILWDGWEKFIMGDNITYPPPNFPITPANYTRLADYLGVPDPGEVVGGSGGLISALPFAAYQCIYNEYYRDQNLINEVNYKLPNGVIGDPTELLKMRKRAWEHDYFTASLPFAQKGQPVTIPMIGNVELAAPGTANQEWVQASTGTPVTVADLQIAGGQMQSGGGTNPAINMDPNGSLVVNNGESTINDLRRAFRLQEWLEKNARAGTRYIESILSHFGIKSSDARLQRPEYITGTKSPVIISEVLNTSGETDGLPQGNMAGHGVSVTSGKYGDYFCEEHGFIMGIMSVMPKTAYQQGLPKTFTRSDPYDYYWPSFANIGEQEVRLSELYAWGPNMNDVFGYVPRYAEYKFMPSRVAGDFKTNLDFWHLGRIFADEPALNQEFIECDPGKRIFAVEDTFDSLYAHVLNKVRAVRAMPKFGNPSF